MVRRLGIIVNGATGALARRQHLRALLAIRDEGGLPLTDGQRVVPDPVLVARNAQALGDLAEACAVRRWTTDLAAALASGEDQIFFDAGVTGLRFEVVARAIKAGLHVYCEKPIATSLDQAMELVKLAEAAGIRHGTVQDKILMPGFRKLRRVRESGFLGRILEARLEFGRWIFDGSNRPAQRPSWNYRKRDGGGLVLDMFPHWRYMLDYLVGDITAVNCTCRTNIDRRIDENGTEYAVDVEDAALAQVEIAGGVMAVVNSSWCTRIRRDDVITLQVDGTKGSAFATPHACYTQAEADTPAPSISVDAPQPMNFYRQWREVEDDMPPVNSYRAGWEMFIRHAIEGSPFPFTLRAGARGVQFAELAYLSNATRRWVDVPKL